MLKVGITGQSGFIGTALFNTIGLYPDKYIRVPFEDSWYSNQEKLISFVKKCDVIVHLAAVNRHSNPQILYDTNIMLVRQLIEAIDISGVRPHVLFSSSIQESLNNPYGKSKLEGQKILQEWAKQTKTAFTGLVIPNVFGEFSKPNYNTFIATFSDKLIKGETVEVIENNSVKLIHIGSLCHFILSHLEQSGIRKIEVPYDFCMNVTDVLERLTYFNNLYTKQGIIPILKDRNDLNLFNTFRSYIEPAKMFLVNHCDERGSFAETIKTGVGGQVSYSITKPGVTRGNHYHTRKIERFIVIKGKARIELRKIGTDEIISFDLDGTEPAYVDMPVWYTHNITNIGKDDLYTEFWINEWYDPNNSDTYFEKV